MKSGSIYSRMTNIEETSFKPTNKLQNQSVQNDTNIVPKWESDYFVSLQRQYASDQQHNQAQKHQIELLESKIKRLQNIISKQQNVIMHLHGKNKRYQTIIIELGKNEKNYVGEHTNKLNEYGDSLSVPSDWESSGESNTTGESN
eukprot:278380_1